MPDTAEEHQKATIVWRKNHAEDLWSIRIRPEQRLTFEPGQYATLGVQVSAEVLERPYSIVSSPKEDEVEFFFELVRRGGLTPRLYALQVGDPSLMRREAKGLFTLDDQSGHKQHYLVCTVTGVSPYVSMVRTLVHEAKEGRPIDLKVVVLQAASRSREFAYHDELAGLAQEFDWLHYIPTVSRPWEDPSWRGEVGRVEDVLRKHLDSLGLEPSNTTAYLCGQPQMIQNSKGILERKGFAKEFIREELYWAPQKQGN